MADPYFQSNLGPNDATKAGCHSTSTGGRTGALSTAQARRKQRSEEEKKGRFEREDREEGQRFQKANSQKRSEGRDITFILPC
ncbi:hypothetical protein V492_07363 [Pseudogymnoascus sp. VKM F-4246]|nr:hypothetical protein V492_07363 [Pseudogymnoascus sp. VKM F-4246]